jgi:hypothetical protein
LTTSGVSGTQKSYIITGLDASTAYAFSVTAKDATGNTAANSPIIVNATTLAGLPASPTPTSPAAKVISIFSDAYANLAATDFFPGWGQTTAASQTTLGGNAVMKYANFGYMGIALANPLDASGMNKLHVDILPTTETSVRITTISAGHELPTSVGTLIPNVWNSFDILLSTFTGVVNSSIIQFKLDGGTGKTFYMDNLYFFNDTATGLNDIRNAGEISCYPNPASNQLTVNANSEISQVVVRNLLGQTVKTSQVNGLEKSIDLEGVAAGNYLVTIKLANGQLSTQKMVKL